MPAGLKRNKLKAHQKEQFSLIEAEQRVGRCKQWGESELLHVGTCLGHAIDRECPDQLYITMDIFEQAELPDMKIHLY